jgi:hypothetical protein
MSKYSITKQERQQFAATAENIQALAAECRAAQEACRVDSERMHANATAASDALANACKAWLESKQTLKLAELKVQRARHYSTLAGACFWLNFCATLAYIVILYFTRA